MKKSREIKDDILFRVRVVYLLFVLVGIGIISMICLWQYGPRAAELHKKAQKITYQQVSLNAERGDILAVDGRLLATSTPIYQIRVDFGAMGLKDELFYSEVGGLASGLSNLFRDKSASGYKSMLVSLRKEANADKDSRTNRYKLISPRRIDFLELDTLKKFPLFKHGVNKSGLIIEQINKRIRPHGSLASRTIGSVNQSGVRVGIEGAFDQQLRGTDGVVMKKKISGSFKVPVDDISNIEPINGIDVVTTIDVDMQDVAESALKTQLDIGGADWGSVILMEVETGEVRVMSNLTRKAEGEFVEDYNYAIGRCMEPGSTFKLATLITLLDDAKISLDKVYDIEGGECVVGKVKVIDSHPEEELSLRDIFRVSSNVGFAKAVHEHYVDNPERFVDNICKLGFDKPISVSIAGEGRPTVKHPGERWWDGTTLVRMSFGYALETSLIHTLSLYNAVANDGKMVRPKLVKELREYGQVIRSFPTEVLNPSICSKETLKSVQECLKDVVAGGTGRILKSPYYTVAAKTGTAQIAQGNRGYFDKHGRRHYLATLVGYFPADNPKYTCIVSVKTSSNINYYGSSLAGPVFRAIADRVYMSDHTLERNNIEESVVFDSTLKAVKGGYAEELGYSTNKLSCDIKGIRRENGWVTTTVDEKGDIELERVEVKEGIVPNVIGMGLKEAIYLLERSGLRVSFSNIGQVVSQSIEAGSNFERGTLIKIKLVM